ncbi:MAG: hypothetical protein ACLQGV_17815 [Bryobacteraceae bacterium]
MRRLIIGAGILASCCAPIPAQGVPHSERWQDPRLARLQEFFDGLGSPVGDLAPEFLAAADRHGLDWRLLPSISVIESGGGKNFSKNNIFGWGSATRGFASVRGSIDWVAQRLANSKLYKGKDLDGILATYNPRPGYRARVKSVMRMLAPDPPLAPQDALSARVNLRSGPHKQALRAPAP